MKLKVNDTGNDNENDDVPLIRHDGLKESITTLHATIGVAAQIHGDLGMQGEQIRRSRARLPQLTHDLVRADTITTRMYKAATRNKLVVCCILFLLVFVIVLVMATMLRGYSY